MEDLKIMVGDLALKVNGLLRNATGYDLSQTTMMLLLVVVLFVAFMFYSGKWKVVVSAMENFLSGEAAGPTRLPIGGIEGVSEKMDNNVDLCRVAINGGLASTTPQNLCNPTASGEPAGDWMCRNDGYNAANIAALGEQ